MTNNADLIRRAWCWLVHRIVWRPIAITGGRRCTLCGRTQPPKPTTGAYGPAPNGPPMTADKVAELPENTEVIVIWSGGNGPHHYTISVDAYGERYANSGHDRMRFYNPLTFVGQERYHTRVWLADIKES